MTARLPHETRRPDAATMALLRDTRAAIAARPVDLAAAVYRHLPSFAPRTKELMAAEIRAHGDSIVRELLRAVEVLDALSSLEDDLRRLGASHEGLGEHFPYVGQALVRAVRELFPNSEGGPLGSAWLEVFEWLAAEMMKGTGGGAGAGARVAEQSPAYWRSYVEDPPAAGASAAPPGPPPVRTAAASAPRPSVSRPGPTPAPVAPGLEPGDSVPSGPVGAVMPDAAPQGPLPAASPVAGPVDTVGGPAAEGSAEAPSAPERVNPAADPTISFDRGELFERLARADDLRRAASGAEAPPPAATPPAMGTAHEPAAGTSVAGPPSQFRPAARDDASELPPRPVPPEVRSTPPRAQTVPPNPRAVPPEEQPVPPHARDVPVEARSVPLDVRPVSPSGRMVPPEGQAARPVSPAGWAGVPGAAGGVPSEAGSAPPPGGRMPPAPGGRMPPAAGVRQGRPRRSRNPWSWGSRSRKAERQSGAQSEPRPAPPRIDPAMYDSPPEVVAPSGASGPGPQNLDLRRGPAVPAPRRPVADDAPTEVLRLDPREFAESADAPVEPTAVGESVALPPELAASSPTENGPPPGESSAVTQPLQPAGTQPLSAAPVSGGLRGVGTGWPRTSPKRPVRPAASAEPDLVNLGDAPAQE